MKILIYGDYYKLTSGYARQIRDLLPYLEKNNEVRLVALDYNGFPIDRDRYVYHTKTPDVQDYYAKEVLHYALDDFKPDIVLTVQDFWMLPKISFSLAHPGPWKWVHWGTLDGDPYDLISRESLNWVHYCFFHSHFGAIETKMANPNVMGEVLYPSVDPKIFHKLDKDALKKEFKLDGFNVLICNARGQARKNVPVLLDAFKLVLDDFPETVLILSSGITRSKTDAGVLDGYDLDRFINFMGLNEHVFLPRNISGGPIDDKTLNINYNIADINVLASTGEGFGFPFVEAGISEVPSIGINHSAVREIVRDRGLLVEPRTYMYTDVGTRYYMCHPEDLAVGIKQLLKDNKLRAEYGKNAHEFARKLTPDSRARLMLDAFDRLIKTNAQPPARR